MKDIINKKKKSHSRVLERYNGLKLGWLRDSLHFIALLAAIFLLFRFGIGLALVSGDSMLPVLKDGELVVYLRVTRTYKQGDVISLRVPSGDYYAKRVIAVGGDVVDIRDGKVYVNGQPEPALDYAYDQAAGSSGTGSISAQETLEAPGAIIYPYTVRKGNVFVLGDNRSESMDSRSFGEVNKRQIRGRILCRISLRGIRKIT